MLTNLSQAVRYLKTYMDLHDGFHFNSLLQYAENVKQHETNDEIGKRKYQLGQLRNLLASDFQVTQNEIDELTLALKNGVDQFYSQLIKVLLEHYQNPTLFTAIEEEIVEISNDLQ